MQLLNPVAKAKIFVVFITCLAVAFVPVYAQADTRVTAIAWSPDGTKIASYTWNGQLTVADYPSGEIVYRSQQHRVEAIAWNPVDSNLLAFSRLDPTFASSVWIVDLSIGQALHEYKLEEKVFELEGGGIASVFYGESVRALAWNPDGTELAMGTAYIVSGWRPLAVLFYDLDEAQVTKTFSLSNANILALSWNSSYLVVAQLDGSVSFWNTDTLTTVTELDQVETICDVAWHPSENIVAIEDCLSGEGILIWDVDNDMELVSLENERSPFAWSPDGAYIAIPQPISGIEIWDTQTGESLFSLETDAEVRALDWNPDGTQLAYSDSNTGEIAFTNVFDH